MPLECGHLLSSHFKFFKTLRGYLSTYSTPSLHQLTSPGLTINTSNLDNTKLTKHFGAVAGEVKLSSHILRRKKKHKISRKEVNSLSKYALLLHFEVIWRIRKEKVIDLIVS
jgi:hypothetical protein